MNVHFLSLSHFILQANLFFFYLIILIFNTLFVAFGPVAEVLLEEMPEETVVTDVNATPLEAEEDVAAQIALLIEKLTPLFDAAASGLKDALSHTSALPKLSEPTGNDIAYEKFLNIYNELYGLGADEQPDPSFKIEA